MSQGNVEVVQRAIAAINDHDFESFATFDVESAQNLFRHSSMR